MWRQTSSVDRRAIAGLALIVIAILVGLAWALWPVSDDRRVEQLARIIAQGTLEQRQAALWELRSIGGPAAADIAGRTLETDPDPDIREAAAYALQKMGAHGQFELLRSAAVKEPSPSVQIKLVRYLARLDYQRAAPWLGEASDGPLSWLGLGATLARLECVDLDAAPDLYRYLAAPDKAMRHLAVRSVTPWVALMSEAIGRPVDLPELQDSEITDQHAADITAWWQRWVTAKLMRDNVVWVKDRDARWHRIKRLMRARAKAIRLLRLDSNGSR